MICSPWFGPHQLFRHRICPYVYSFLIDTSLDTFTFCYTPWKFGVGLWPMHKTMKLQCDDGCFIYQYQMSAGGYDGTSFLDIVEVYDPATNTWTSGTPLTSMRSGHASAVCYQHVTPHSELSEQCPTVIKKVSKRGSVAGSSSSSSPDVLPSTNNIIGTLSNTRR